MRVKRKLNTEEVGLIEGLTSLELIDKCPDLRQVFPATPCTYLGCEWVIDQPEYMNCTFVAAEAGGVHTLEAIGKMMHITREGVRLIEVRALKKLKAGLQALQQVQDHDGSALCESNLAAGTNHVKPDHEGAELTDECYIVRVHHG